VREKSGSIVETEDGKEAPMLDLARRAILTGVGLGLIAKDKIDEAVQRIREESNLTEEESRKLARELLDQSDEARKKLNDLIKKTTEELFAHMDIPSRQDLANLEERVEKLEESISKDSDSVS